MAGYLRGEGLLRMLSKLVILLVAVFVSTDIVQAREAVTPSGATVEYSHDPVALIVSYALNIGELAEPGGGPKMQIYGDGLAVIHYPDYMTRAGNFELQLSSEEMAALLSSLVTHGVLAFDATSARASMRETATLRQNDSGIMHYVSDPSTTVIEMHIVRYQTPGKVSAQSINPDSTIRWSGLQTDARQYPDHVAIQGLAAAEQTLRTLMERPDMVKSAAGSHATTVTPGSN